MKPFFKAIPLSLGLVLIVFSIWLTYCCSQSLEWDAQGNLLAHSYSVWGDWSAHFTFISNLRERGLSWLFGGENPVFAQAPFQYPFLSHVLTALFDFIFRAGTISSTYITSLLLLFLLPFSLFSFFRELNLKSWTAGAAVVLFLLMGGIQIFDSGLNPMQPVTNQFDAGSIFTQFVVFEFFPQRAFLFGLLTFTSVLTFLLRRMKSGRLTSWSLIGSGLLIALTILLHIHTWIALAVGVFFFFIFNPGAPFKLKRKTILGYGVGLGLVSFIFIYLLLLRTENPFSSGWDWWYPGWAQNEKARQEFSHQMNPLWFWFYNTGFFIPMSLAGFYYTLRKTRNSFLTPIFAAGLFLFVFALLINLQPNFYDNLKLFTYAFLFLTPLAASALEWLWTAGVRGFVKIPLRAACAVLLIFQCASGATDVQTVPEKQKAMFFTSTEMELAQKFKSIRHSPDDLILTSTAHNHWATCLTGNPIVMGYPGWLWTWGINYQEREKRVKSIFLGAPNALSLVESLHIEYIVVNLKDVFEHQPVNTGFLYQHFKLVLQQGDWAVYAVH